MTSTGYQLWIKQMLLSQVLKMSLVLQHHADVDISNSKSETALDLAAQYGRIDTVVILLAASSRPSHVTAKSPLHLAASNGHCSVVAKLLDAGFDINRKVRSLVFHSVVCSI